METSKEGRPRGISGLLLCLLRLVMLLARSEAEGRSFNAELFSTRFFFHLLYLSLVFFLPFPIVFRNGNFFFLFLSLLMSAYLGLNMSETRLNLLFLMVLLSRLETDWWSIDTACYFVCIFLYFSRKLTFFFFPVMSFFFPLFLFSFWWCFYSVPSLSYLEICLMVPSPPQFPPPPLFFEICSLVSGWTRWMKEEEE